MRTIRAITCRASLDGSSAVDEARTAAADGDPSWQQWIEEYDAGRALVLRLEITIAFDRGEQIAETRAVNQGIWIEASPHPPAVAGQLDEIVSKDYNDLSAKLRDEGVDVTATDLADMHAEVELSTDLLRALEENPAGRTGLQPEIGGGA